MMYTVKTLEQGGNVLNNVRNRAAQKLEIRNQTPTRCFRRLIRVLKVPVSRKYFPKI